MRASSMRDVCIKSGYLISLSIVLVMSGIEMYCCFMIISAESKM